MSEEKTQEEQAPQEVKVFGVQGEVLRATITLLTNELPMAKVRQLVEVLEKSPELKIKQDG